MEIKDTYLSKDGKRGIIEFSLDYRAEEEWGIADIYKAISNKTLTCELQIVNAFKHKIPVLIMNKTSRCGINPLKDINAGRAYSEIDSARYKMEEALEHLTKEDHSEFLDGYDEEDKLYFSKKQFVASFYHGETIVIAPNPFCSYLPMEYFKEDKKRYSSFSFKKKFVNEETAKELKNISKELFKKNCDFINAIYNSFVNEGIMKAPANSAFSNGGYFFFVPKDVIEFTLKKNVFPLEFVDDELVEKDKELLIKEVKETAIHLKELDKINKKLDKLKKKLKAKDCNFFYLGKPTKTEEGTWIFWLNPRDQQNNYFGWVSFEDLNDWLKGKGKIMSRDGIAS